ncbi:TPR-like protein [Sistotremastrum niveocremeum HHB9708]|uniref:Pre-mRNA-splicing factor CLF1 n=1 Tax=Sistotremastrum niveocremeum HHB9708 TaxID=1314777 RepID=A0A164S685_9AGAM|nr:TPR-like protein [Sistotremastrum niveocremeum HHB9708]
MTVRRIKNRAPAAIQITAEQLLREAQERQESSFKAPRQRVEDFEELHEYRGRKRKEFEERVRRTRGSLKEWQQYANWEASQGQFDRSRSVFERALDVDARSVPLWMSYTEMELKNRNIQHARNLYDRAVTLLPRIDNLWYKYVYLEELLQNVPGARQVFERWMKWEPDDKAWQAYIKMEERYNELDRASAIYERWIAVRPEPRVWIKWAKFEEERGRLDKAREVFQTAVEFFGDDAEQIEKAQAVFAGFAKMEVRAKEYERARVIFKFALERLPRSKSSTLYAAYTKFEKQHGTRSSIETTLLGKRRIQYEDEISHNPSNYDVWFDYARLEESALASLREEGEGDGEGEEEKAITRVREVYERAVANVPPGAEKRLWRRYIFLWLDYALFEEIETKDYERTREIYKAALGVVPHKQFTFAKLWLNFAKFEVRRLNLPAARKILGTSIGMCPKEKLFKGYIQLELDLREFDNVRQIYHKLLTFNPANPQSWLAYTTLETQLSDITRARAIFELGISQPLLEMPELLWKGYIDFEVEVGEGERERVRALYERLVRQSGHWKVWVAWALFEGNEIRVAADEDEEDEEEEKEDIVKPGDRELARSVFRRGYQDLKSRQENDGRRFLLDAWLNWEKDGGEEVEIKNVQAMMPWKTEKLRDDEYGQKETYSAWVFPDDERENNTMAFKFLQRAHAWKKSQAEKKMDVDVGGSANDDRMDEDEDKPRREENSRRRTESERDEESSSASDGE